MPHTTELNGAQFGVRFERRGEKDPHVLIQLIGEDDDNWFKVGSAFSSYWLTDLIDVLMEAREKLRKEFSHDTPCGFKFPEVTAS